MITMNHLIEGVALINKLTGNSETYYTYTADKVTANIGHYHLEQSYGRIGLAQTVSEGGGVRLVLPGSTKEDLYDQMQTYIKGLEARK
jgi:hypothetical protein